MSFSLFLFSFSRVRWHVGRSKLLRPLTLLANVVLILRLMPLGGLLGGLLANGLPNELANDVFKSLAKSLANGVRGWVAKCLNTCPLTP